ncbi:4-oxalocrotonate tautomerase DmpI [Candidatus Contubernalis alkaliaceticus]|uniref:4-oxalocrotonate tautomerase DmpI n=1 Tax=Candidatus Contubernalis alkaliaceticus TaxID=338645 RepID=UPI001F4C1276|nr:4-oxalocrotonate tautomerase DmpI [Candidatus Contubernalis alkalaceticus]UNC91416.1 tautomerase family protein [Candidatus Contubernalis alkalaceticus]
MPTISFNAPKMTREQKAEIVAEFTKTASRVTNIPEVAFVVYIHEIGPENVGVGGELLLEKKKREGTL